MKVTQQNSHYQGKGSRGGTRASGPTEPPDKKDQVNGNAYGTQDGKGSFRRRCGLRGGLSAQLPVLFRILLYLGATVMSMSTSPTRLDMKGPPDDIEFLYPDSHGGFNELLGEHIPFEFTNRDGSNELTPDILETTRLRAKRGDADASYFLGLLSFYGHHVPQSKMRAAQYFRFSAEKGHVGSQTNLAIMLANGLGIPRNDYEAITWFHRAAQNNHLEAQWWLGKMYVEGRSTLAPDQANAEAFHWLQLAASRGAVPPKHYLGMMYESGIGVPVDYNMARDLYIEASRERLPDSMYNLALMYAHGRGVGQNYLEAVRLLNTAASEHKHPAAALALALMRVHGLGVEVDYGDAFKWLELAMKGETSISTEASRVKDILSESVRNAEDYADSIIGQHNLMNEDPEVVDKHRRQLMMQYLQNNNPNVHLNPDLRLKIKKQRWGSL